MESKNFQPLANNHFSVDCVVLGFDGEQLRVLLIRRMGVEQGKTFSDMKLPGSLIYMDEDLDEAAHRVLCELTGMKSIKLMQFKAYGSKNRTRDPKDVHWLEHAIKMHVDRIITIAYLALVKIDRKLSVGLDEYQACWIPVTQVPKLAFDHNLIVTDALKQVARVCQAYPSRLFDLLPRKFTIAQLRNLFEVVYGKSIDVRNFHKRLSQMPYVIPLEEY
ncbi:MAG: NrtR DNA-binding winged helix domain-containing protein, partial [Bacteroidaceae bacterium]